MYSIDINETDSTCAQEIETEEGLVLLISSLPAQDFDGWYNLDKIKFSELNPDGYFHFSSIPFNGKVPGVVRNKNVPHQARAGKIYK